MSTQLLNIRRVTDDPHYRYKMPALLSKKMPKGRGGSTLLLNVREVADSLHRDVEELCRFFAYELGVAHNTSAASNDQQTRIKGLHSAKTLQELVFAYVDKFVLCPNCHDPETVYQLNLKSAEVRHFCSACHADRARTALVDPRHKLVKFIINREKAIAARDRKAKKKKTKRKGRTTTSKQQCPKAPSSSSGGGGTSGSSRLIHGGYSFHNADPDQWASDFDAAAAAAAPVSESSNEDEVWSSDPEPQPASSEDPAAAQMPGVPGITTDQEVAVLPVDANGASSAHKLAEVVLDVASTLRCLISGPECHVASMKKQHLAKWTAELSHGEMCFALVEGSFRSCSTAASIAKAFELTKRLFLDPLLLGPAPVSPPQQWLLLAAVERHFCTRGDHLLDEEVEEEADEHVRRRLILLPLLLHLFHEEDALSQATLAAWLAVSEPICNKKCDPKLLVTMKEKAEPFVLGLDACSDSDDDDDSDTESSSESED